MMTNEKQEIIRNSASYKLVHAIALWMDQRLLDPSIGLVLPGFGDALTSFFAMPYLYLSKKHSPDTGHCLQHPSGCTHQYYSLYRSSR